MRTIPRNPKAAIKFRNGTYTGFHGKFRVCAETIARATGSPWAFAAAVTTVVAWAFTGPMWGFSDTWQLIINTSTTIITFLMVFLIQNTQHREMLALHLKLDELLRAMKGARNTLVDLEDLSDDELEVLKHQFEQLRGRVRHGRNRSHAVKTH